MIIIYYLFNDYYYYVFLLALVVQHFGDLSFGSWYLPDSSSPLSRPPQNNIKL